MLRCCENCKKEFNSKRSSHRFCCMKCKDFFSYHHNKGYRKKKSLDNYYKNRKRILKYQIKRLERLRREDLDFRRKYYARHKACKHISLVEKICEDCKKVSATQRHHEDYDKPLKVRLLCKKCHDKLNQKLGRA